jgi:hypothetical protein
MHSPGHLRHAFALKGDHPNALHMRSQTSGVGDISPASNSRHSRTVTPHTPTLPGRPAARCVPDLT